MSDERNRNRPSASVTRIQRFDAASRDGTMLSADHDRPECAQRCSGSGRGRPLPEVASSGPGANSAWCWSPTWRLFLEYWRMVGRHVPDRGERLRCYTRVMGWLLVDWHGVRLLIEPIAALGPGVRAGANTFGRLLLGALRVARVSVAELRPRHR